MRIYSAAEAIGPAWEHTTGLLWRPRRWGTLIKLSLVAILTELAGFGFSVRLPAPLTVRMGGGGLSHQSVLLIGMLTALFTLIAVSVGLALFYLASRLQLVLFDLVARRTTAVAPPWHGYARATWRWIGLKLLFFLAFLVIALPLLLPALLRFSRSMRGYGLQVNSSGDGGIGASAGGFSLPPNLLAEILSLLLIAVPVVIVLAIVYWLIRDFALPSMALEEASIGGALRQLAMLLRAEPSAVSLYLLLRVLLGAVAGSATYLFIVIACAISALPPTLLGYMVWLSLHRIGSGMFFVWTAAGVLLALWLAWCLLLTIVALGTLLVFYQAWPLYFLGGRYPLLGNLLEPSIAVPVWTPPPSFPGDDEDDGPGFPMDPVPA